MTSLLLAQLLTVTIAKGSITTAAPPPTATEAAAILLRDASDRNRTGVVAFPRYGGPWSVVAPCWSCDVQRLREARDELARSAWWDTSRGRTFNRLNVDSRQRLDPFYGRRPKP